MPKIPSWTSLLETFRVKIETTTVVFPLTKSTIFVLKSLCCAFTLFCSVFFHSPRSVLTCLALRWQLPPVTPAYN
jgi:hypothetical protein